MKKYRLTFKDGMVEEIEAANFYFATPGSPYMFYGVYNPITAESTQFLKAISMDLVARLEDLKPSSMTKEDHRQLLVDIAGFIAKKATEDEAEPLMKRIERVLNGQ